MKNLVATGLVCVAALVGYRVMAQDDGPAAKRYVEGYTKRAMETTRTSLTTGCPGSGSSAEECEKNISGIIKNCNGRVMNCHPDKKGRIWCDVNLENETNQKCFFSSKPSKECSEVRGAKRVQKFATNAGRNYWLCDPTGVNVGGNGSPGSKPEKKDAKVPE